MHISSSSVTASGQYRRVAASSQLQFSSAVRCVSHGHAAASGLYSTKRMASPNFSQLDFFIMYPVVRHYKDRFGIHVNTRTVVTFQILTRTCTTCLRMYLLRIRYHSYSSQIQRQQQYDTRTYNSGNTDWCYFLLLLAAVVVRLSAPDRDSCVLALCCGLPIPRSCFNEAFCKFPFGFSRGVLFHLLQGIQYFSGILFFNQNQPWICMKQ